MASTEAERRPSRAPPPPAFVNKLTASIYQDYEPRREVTDPFPVRPWIRIIITSMILAMLILSITYIALTDAHSGVESVTGKPMWKKIRRQEGMVPTLPATLITNTSSSINTSGTPLDLAFGVYQVNSFTFNASGQQWTCPCASSGIPWCSFITLDLIRWDDQACRPVVYASEHECSGTQQIPTQLCHGDSSSTQSCHGALDAVYPYVSGSHVSHTSPYLNSPLQLYLNVLDQMTDNIIGAARVWNQSAQAQLTLNMLFAMVLQQYSNTSSSVQDYWRAGCEYREIYFPRAPPPFFAFGMEINWTQYTLYCNPSYCQRTILRYSALHRFFNALVQVGGAGSVILFAMRYVLWPAVCYVMTFKQKPPSLPRQ